MAPAVDQHPGARPTEREAFVDRVESSARDVGVVRDVRQDHPHAGLDGYVYLGCTTMDEETGDEVERVEALPCRRCAEGE
jgi:predicted GNAT superfamily acetyltransferase